MTGAAASLEERLGSLDTGLFEGIESQTTRDDQRTLLACQAAARELRQPYTYLEIGSYLGGSLQPHAKDPRCARIVSIDKRPDKSTDNTGIALTYLDNSTERMLENLREVPGAEVSKIECLDGETPALDLGDVPATPDLCFIDGEHSDAAALSDYRYCRAAMSDHGAVLFHDANIIYNGLAEMIDGLSSEGTPFHAYNLPSTILVVEIGDFPLHRHPAIAAMLVDNHVGYLASLQANDHYRRWVDQQPIKLVRTVKNKLQRRGINP